MPDSEGHVPFTAEQLGSWQMAALEQSPIAIVIFSSTDGIIFTNKACEILFEPEVVKFGEAVLDLPIIWPISVQHTTGQILKSDPSSNHHRTSDAFPHKSTHPISISSSASTQRTTADVHITTLEVPGQNLRLLTFENVKSYEPRSPSPSASEEDSSEDASKGPDEGDRATTAASSPHPLRAKSSDPYLEKQLARLREAIYFSNDDSGFMIDVDETVVFPNWNGTGTDVKPVRLKNGAADFLDWYDIWDTDFKEKLPLSAYPARRLNTERVKHRAYRIGLRVDGKDLITECSGDPLFDKDTGEYIGGVVWVRTLGEKDEVVLAEMKANLSDYQTICERLPHILWTMTPEGYVDYLTNNWYEFTGLSESKNLSDTFVRAIHPDDLQRFRDSTVGPVESKSSAFIEARIQRHDGAWLWFGIAAKPLLDEERKLLKWYGTMTEIQNLVSEREEADRKKSQMQDMLTLADVSLFMLDEQSRLTMLQGKPFWRTTHHGPTSTALAEIEDGGIPVFATNAHEVVEGSNKRADFEFELRNRWYKCRLVKDIDTLPNSGGLLGCTIDITDQRQKSLLVIENSRLVTERAVALEKNRLKDEFLAHMSHEVRTPIAGVVGMAEVLQESDLTEQQMETLRDIIDSAKNLLEIVNDILDLSKIDSGKMTFERVEFNISDLADQVSRVFQHSVRNKPVELKIAEDMTPNLMMIGDPTKVRQIISNLLSNAIKFTSRGSVILSVSAKAGEMCLSVKDTGIGISETTLSKLFSPFVQGDSSTARQYGGTGLGLAICRGLAEMMGGSLNIESKLGVGTTASLRLPRDINSDTLPANAIVTNNGDDQNDNDTHPPKVCRRPTGGNLTILVVEDNAINQKFALHLVKKHGYHGASAFNGQAALDYLMNEPANIALILMDCQMPIMDGYETTKRIRTDERYAAWKDIPIVALTASAITGDKERCHAAGMHEYLTKPVSYKHFQAVVGKWLPARTKEELEADSVVK